MSSLTKIRMPFPASQTNSQMSKKQQPLATCFNMEDEGGRMMAIMVEGAGMEIGGAVVGATEQVSSDEG